MHKLADHQLIKLIQETQNEQACEELIRRYYGILRQLVKYKVPAYADIDDIVQEILIKMITKIDQLRDPNKFKAWIQRIVYSQIYDNYRTVYPKHSSTAVQEENELLDAYLITQSSEEAILHKLEMSDIYDIILGFPSDNIKPFLLHHLNHLSYAEIAAVSCEKTTTIRGRIARSKAGLSKELFNITVPQEIRTRLATKLSQIATDGSYVVHHLKADYFQNKILLDELDSKRTAVSKPTIYFSESLDNLMLLSEINAELSTCIIKVKSQDAVPILINRIPSTKKIHCIFLSPEHLNYAKNYLDFTSETTGFAFLASPSAQITSAQTSNLTIKSSLDDVVVSNCLLEQDPELNIILTAAKKEYGSGEQTYRFYAAQDPANKQLCAYAFFVRVDTHLWELSRYAAFTESDVSAVKTCIAAGTKSLIKQGFYISNFGVPDFDTVFTEIAAPMGFKELYCFTSGIAIKI